jgi:hypothetical protein
MILLQEKAFGNELPIPSILKPSINLKKTQKFPKKLMRNQIEKKAKCMTKIHLIASMKS